MLIKVGYQIYRVTSYTDNFIVVHNGKYTETFKIDEVEYIFAENRDEVIPDCLINKNVLRVTEGLENGEEHEYTDSRS